MMFTGLTESTKTQGSEAKVEGEAAKRACEGGEGSMILEVVLQKGARRVERVKGVAYESF